MIVENYDHILGNQAIMEVECRDMIDLGTEMREFIERDPFILCFEMETQISEVDCHQLDGLNFDISKKLNTLKSTYSNKKLEKFLSTDKNQKTMDQFFNKPDKVSRKMFTNFNIQRIQLKRKPEEPQIFSSDHQLEPKKQKLISEYTCHQSGSEMFEILERSIERKHQQVHISKTERLPQEKKIIPKENSSKSVLPNPPQTVNSNESTSKVADQKEQSSTKPKTYMERIKEQAKNFHNKHSKCTVTIKKRDKAKTRDILNEEEDFSLLQIDSSIVNQLFSY